MTDSNWLLYITGLGLLGIVCGLLRAFTKYAFDTSFIKFQASMALHQKITVGEKNDETRRQRNQAHESAIRWYKSTVFFAWLWFLGPIGANLAKEQMRADYIRTLGGVYGTEPFADTAYNDVCAGVRHFNKKNYGIDHLNALMASLRALQNIQKTYARQSQ